MASRTARIVTFDKQELPRDWRRFAACLCFMLFGILIVEGGTEFWDQSLRHGLVYDRQAYWQGLTRGLLGILLYWCGRSLWYGNRRSRIWMLLSVASAAAYAAWAIKSQSSTPWFAQGGLSAIESVLCYCYLLPWLSALVAALLLSTAPLSLLRRHSPGWVVIAFAWTATSYGMSSRSHFAGAIAHVWWHWFGFAPDIRPLLLALVPSVIASLCLLLRSRWVRWVAVGMATAELSMCFLLTATLYPRMVADAIHALFYRVPVACGPLTSPFPFGIWLFNRYTFQACVALTMIAGPWILIAIYARRYPIRVPPDDGSPWPRRYCGHCRYNLHGITAPVCPECGRRLIE